MIPKIYIGTSGWNYNHWQRIFYDEDCPKSKWLDFYARNFSTVEVNATFYRLPQPQTFENWRLKTPEKFLWAVKANKYITHIRRLKEASATLAQFFKAASLLKEKLGPILFQLPPNLSFDENLLHQFCQCLKAYPYRYALEIRHPSWLDSKAFKILTDHNIASCISDTAGRYPYTEEVTADFVYIRLHGSQTLYKSEYTEKELQIWAQKITKWNRDTYVYFDNDFQGYAPQNARRLKEILNLI